MTLLLATVVYFNLLTFIDANVTYYLNTKTASSIPGIEHNRNYRRYLRSSDVYNASNEYVDEYHAATTDSSVTDSTIRESAIKNKKQNHGFEPESVTEYRIFPFESLASRVKSAGIGHNKSQNLPIPNIVYKTSNSNINKHPINYLIRSATNIENKLELQSNQSSTDPEQTSDGVKTKLHRSQSNRDKDQTFDAIKTGLEMGQSSTDREGTSDAGKEGLQGSRRAAEHKMPLKRARLCNKTSTKQDARNDRKSQTDDTDPAASYQKAAARLQKFILQKHNIRHRLPPYNVNYPTAGNSSGVLLKFTPFRILSLDEVQQSVSVSSYIMVKWFDSTLTWDPALFGNINKTLIERSKLWTPTIVLPTSTGHGLYLDTTDYLLLSLKKLPTISMKFPFQFTVQCDLDLSRYPFDQQTCLIIFTELNEKELFALDSKETDFEMAKALHTSGEWEIMEWHHLERSEDEPYSLRWVLKIRRQSTFYVANLLVPLLQTSFMTLLVFWIPAESGEKMSYLVSMFVSTSVFLFIINDEMPRSIWDLPTINIVVVAVNSEIILVSIATLVVLHRYRYLQSIKSDQISSKSAAKVGRRLYRTEEKNERCSGNQPENKNAINISQRVCPISYVNNSFQAPVDTQTTTSYCIDRKEKVIQKEGNEKTAKMTFTFGIPEDDRRYGQDSRRGLHSHGRLDKIFFNIFVLINLIGAMYASFKWF